MPNTLIESMCIGLPIACSDKGPMPKILKDGGVYFDPEDERSIKKSIEKIINSDKLRIKISSKAKKLSAQYSWKRCSNETMEYISELLQTQ